MTEKQDPGATPRLHGRRLKVGPVVLVLFGTLFLASVDNQLLIPLLPVLSVDLGEPVLL